MAQAGYKTEVQQGERFAFGENWSRFLSALNDERVAKAEDSLRRSLRMTTLEDKSFLDIGSGSGLFSLAAYRLGAAVRSFDYDADSVGCTQELYRRYEANPNRWTISQGSALDAAFLASLGEFDIVYSWGVLHHTGDMWKGLDLASKRVRENGQLLISIYNDQGWRSKYWTSVKRAYNRRPWSRPLLIAFHAPSQLFGRYIFRALTGRLKMERGMSLYHDMIDWLGGYPFEVATPADLKSFFSVRGFDLELERTVGSKQGCNEFVFRRTSQTNRVENP